MIANIITLEKENLPENWSDTVEMYIISYKNANWKELPSILNDKCIKWDTENECFIEDVDEQCCMEKTSITQEYNPKFNEFDRCWSAKVARGLATTTEMNTARASLVLELVTALNSVGA